MTAPLRVGLLLDSPMVGKYVYGLVQWAAEQPDIDISHLLIHPVPSTRSRFQHALRLLAQGRMYQLISKIAFKAVVALERLALRANAVHHDHYDEFDLRPLVQNQLVISPIVSESGLVYRFGKKDMSQIRALCFDLLIRCGTGILRGEILSAAKFGIISFHHGDNRINRGGPASFWECYYAWSQTGFVIQQLTEELDGGSVLVRGNFMTRFMYSLNHATVCTKSNAHFKNLLSFIASSRRLPPAEKSLPYSAPLYRPPACHTLIIYICKLCTRTFARLLRRMLCIRDRWGISVIKANWRASVFWRSTRVKTPRGRFWADPFLVEHQGSVYCFVEDFVYKTGRGHITALQVLEDGVREIGPCLSEPFHLSFPFVFNYQGQLYMCPESHDARQIRLYRCHDMPLDWELAAVIMEDVSASDSMLFEHHGKWWMLTNIDPSGTGDHSSELYLFYCDSPLAPNWTSHPMNPIYIDSSRARNAGLIVEDGKIFRAAQRQAFEFYGSESAIFEITKLSESDYAEEFVCNIKPKFHKRLRGTHHLSTTGGQTVVDHVSLSISR
jgi:hypothetical protein